MIRLTVLGTPVAQHRKRISTVGKFPRVYPVKIDTLYREKLYFEAKALNMKPIDRKTPLSVSLCFYRPYPKSMPKSKQALALPVTKPDTDNYVKQVFDALNGLIWEDDAQIVEHTAQKLFSDRPRLEILVQDVSGGITPTFR